MADNAGARDDFNHGLGLPSVPEDAVAQASEPIIIPRSTYDGKSRVESRVRKAKKRENSFSTDDDDALPIAPASPSSPAVIGRITYESPGTTKLVGTGEAAALRRSEGISNDYGDLPIPMGGMSKAFLGRQASSLGGDYGGLPDYEARGSPSADYGGLPSPTEGSSAEALGNTPFEHVIGFETNSEEPAGIGDGAADLICAECQLPINGLGTNVTERFYHSECLVCSRCNNSLNSSVRMRDGCFYCTQCFDAVWGKRCNTCKERIKGKVVSPTQDQHYHPKCFKCVRCSEVITDAFGIEPDGSAICGPCVEAEESD